MENITTTQLNMANKLQYVHLKIQFISVKMQR